ncbi:DUF4959 domain-containing protein [Prolixibacteraceae bacterium JC049]|nr:DUF4959 domain-containing protein [Prolixibacteraceae bacterium JC049]
MVTIKKNNQMRYSIILILLSVLIYSCEDKFQRTLEPTESTPPGVVTNVTVKNIAGGAVLYYDVPLDDDLSYVKADYIRNNGDQAEAKSSRYVDSLVVEGFGNTTERDVTLYAVDRNQNASEPTSVKIQPLTPPVKVVASTFELVADFGGIQARWANDDKAELGVVFMRKDTLTDKFETLETYYTNAPAGKRSIRNMKVKEREFSVYMKDRWDNRSDTLSYKITPLFETAFDKGLFRKVLMEGDYDGVFGWVHERMWDGKHGEGNGYSSPGGQGVWPHYVTFDMGIVGKLSRLQLKQRSGRYVFAEGNLRRFEVFGAVDLPENGDDENWIQLGDFESIKPSDLPMGKNTNEDIAVANEGEDFIFDISAPKVRYIRIKVKETWAAGDNFQISELTIFGDNR